MSPPGEWNEYEKLVLEEIKRGNETNKLLFVKIEDLHSKINTLEVRLTSDISALKVKAGIWGIAGGIGGSLVTVSIAIAGFLLRKP